MENVTNEQVERVTKAMAREMVRQPELFPIAHTLQEHAKSVLKLQGEPASFWVTQSLIRRCGLSSVARRHLSALNTLWWSLDKSVMDQAKDATLKSALLDYVDVNGSEERVLLENLNLHW